VIQSLQANILAAVVFAALGIVDLDHHRGRDSLARAVGDGLQATGGVWPAARRSLQAAV
jgi:hypothetical protein